MKKKNFPPTCSHDRSTRLRKCWGKKKMTHICPSEVIAVKAQRL